MPFISFAQNAEDVMLYRALKHLESGCYIDIGANHPVEDSVTKAFYDRGWSGVNVEPVTQWFQLLHEARTRDINLKIAVSNSSEPLDFYEVAETGLSTLDPERAECCRQEGLKVIRNTVEVWTLESIFEKAGQAETHFLKIDVEGAETQVITSGNWAKYRPWIVVVESTRPNTNISEHQAWEPVLTSHDYKFVWFDGINRFYVAVEHLEALKHAFCFPVNVLDYYRGHHEINASAAHSFLANGFVGHTQTTEVMQLTESLRLEQEAHSSALRAFREAEIAHGNAVAELNRIRNNPLAAAKIGVLALLRMLRHSIKKQHTCYLAVTGKIVSAPSVLSPLASQPEALVESPEVLKVYIALNHSANNE